jgi:hypothetical protein
VLEADEEVFEVLLGHLSEVEVPPPSGAPLLGHADVYLLKDVPELSRTTMRSPARSKTVILENDAKLSTPAWVRESEAKTILFVQKNTHTIRHDIPCGLRHQGGIPRQNASADHSPLTL